MFLLYFWKKEAHPCLHPVNTRIETLLPLTTHVFRMDVSTAISLASSWCHDAAFMVGIGAGLLLFWRPYCKIGSSERFQMYCLTAARLKSYGTACTAQ